MDQYVKHIALLEHAEALNYVRNAYKKHADHRKVLLTFTGLEEQYFDMRALRAPGAGGGEADLQARYATVGSQLELLVGAGGAPCVLGEAEGDRAVVSQLQLYCTLRHQLLDIYHDLATDGLNVVDYIPKLRSLLTSCTDLKAEGGVRSGQPEPEQHLHQLMQWEIEFLLAVHECMWDTNRLQYPAAVVHLASARRTLRHLTGLNAQHRPKLIAALASLYAAAYAKVTLVFLRVLHHPTSSAANDPFDADADEAAAADAERDAAADATARVKDRIDAADLAAIWPVCKKGKKVFSLGSHGSAGGCGDAAANVLRSLDALREDAHARMGTAPSFHIFYNASAYGFADALNLSTRRLPLPRYLPIGQRELEDGEALTGLKGFPCIASYPLSCGFPPHLVPLLSSLPLLDAGRVELLPAVPSVETFDPAVVESARLAKLKEREREKEAAAKKGDTSDLKKTLPSAGPSTFSMSTLDADDAKKPPRKPFPSGYSLASECTQSHCGESGVGGDGGEDEQPGGGGEGMLDLTREETSGSRSQASRVGELFRAPSQRSSGRTAPAKPAAAGDKAAAPTPKASRPPVTVAAVRIDLLFYAVVLFDGVPDRKWITEWLERFGRCMVAIPSLVNAP